MIEHFEYNDIVLYAKGWYQRSENICEDLNYLLSKTFYNKVCQSEQDIAVQMMIVLEELYQAAGVYSGKKVPYGWLVEHHLFENQIRWFMALHECSRDKAVIYAVLHVLQGLSSNDIALKRPRYGKREHFRMGRLMGSWPISMTYAEMNRRAAKVFGGN